jgi:hypothetical protein
MADKPADKPSEQGYVIPTNSHSTSSGSRSILPQTNQILQRAWKSKDLPPLIKTFTWRLIRRALATAERATRYSVHIDPHCSVCGQLEDDAHLFFHCQLPRAVWFSSAPSFRTDDLYPMSKMAFNFHFKLSYLPTCLILY